MECLLKEISAKLNIGYSTVNVHLYNIKRKLDIIGKCMQLKHIEIDISTAISRIKFSSKSTKDFEIFMLILAGITNKEICKKLFMTYRAIRHHRERLLIRNNCQNMYELISIFYGEKREDE